MLLVLCLLASLVTAETGKQKWPSSKYWCWANNAGQFRQAYIIKLPSFWIVFSHYIDRLGRNALIFIVVLIFGYIEIKWTV